MLTKRSKPNDARNYSVDLVQDSGCTDYVDSNGDVVENAPIKSVMVTAQTDLANLTGYEPGTIAFLAGFSAMWQLSASGSWVSLL